MSSKRQNIIKRMLNHNWPFDNALESTFDDALKTELLAVVTASAVDATLWLFFGCSVVVVHITSVVSVTGIIVFNKHKNLDQRGIITTIFTALQNTLSIYNANYQKSSILDNINSKQLLIGIKRGLKAGNSTTPCRVRLANCWLSECIRQTLV